MRSKSRKHGELHLQLVRLVPAGGWAHRVLWLLLLAGAAWWLDGPVFSLSRREHEPDRLSGFTSAVQQFGEPFGVTLVALSIWVLDPPRRRAVLRLLVAILIATLVAAAIKLAVGRQRPRVTDGQTVIRGPEWPGASKDDPGFPSAHTTVGFAMAQVLARMYPHGRLLFVGLAASCGFARVFGGLHFLTDVLAGSWLGWELGKLVWKSKRLGRWGIAIPDLRWLPAWRPE